MFDKHTIFPIKIGKRQRVIIVSLITMIFSVTCSLWTPYVPHLSWSITALLVVFGFMFAWILDFDVKLQEYYKFLFPPMAIAFIGVYTGYVYTDVMQYILGAFLFVSLYIILLAINVLNVSTVRTVPLKKAALSTLFFLGIAYSFILAYAIADSVGWGLHVQVLGYTVYVLGFALAYLSIASEKIPWLEWIVFMLIAVKINVLVSFVPSQLIVLAIVVTGWNFITLGILQHHVERTTTTRFVREYMIVAAILLVAFILF